MMRRRWRISIALFAVCVALPVAAQSVDQAELGNLPPVAFINYQGPYARIDSREQILELGRGPGRAVRAGDEGSGDLTRYFFIHSVSADTGAGKLDADIFGIGRNAGVDHINALRLIIQGYLEAAYEYGSEDAALLARYITVYNAVYRKNWNYFSSRYKTPVLDNVSPDLSGLSLNYTDWPAGTFILIPLSNARAGSLSALDTGALTSQEVTEQLREESDRSIPERQDMVDLKEREAAEAADTAAVLEEAVAREESAVTGEQAAITRERAELAENRAALAQERDTAAQAVAPQVAPETGTPEQAAAAPVVPAEQEAKLAEREAALDQAEAALDEREAAVAERQDALEELKEEAAQTGDFAEQKVAEAQQEREAIAEDQQALIDGTPPVAAPPRDTLVALMLNTADSPLGTPVKIDAETKALVERSAGLNTVRSRSFIATAGRYYAVAGENRANAAVRLVEIDPASLGIKNQGSDDIHAESLIWQNGTDLYALTVADGTVRLARFTQDLAKEAESEKTLHPFAGLIFQNNTLVTQSADGSVLALDPRTLR
jgi:hypothetical protein